MTAIGRRHVTTSSKSMSSKEMSSKSSRTTLSTIAEAAGVSLGTVSKVLNRRPDVAPSTRALVQELLDEHKYVQRRVEPPRAPTVQLSFDGPMRPYGMEILAGVVDAASDVGVDVVVTIGPRGVRRPGRSRVTDWVGQLGDTARQAVIAVNSEIASSELTALARASVPLVVLDPITMPRARIVSVGSTNFNGGWLATQHLLDLGHRDIAYLGGPASAAPNQARKSGYRGALEAAGVPLVDDRVRDGEFTYATGFEHANALLDEPRRPTAFFAANDEIALGVVEAARLHGLRVPEDVSVVGFDDTEPARLASPPLTTVAQPLHRMGEIALRTALRLSAGEKLDSHHVELATELVVRNSTAPRSVARRSRNN